MELNLNILLNLISIYLIYIHVEYASRTCPIVFQSIFSVIFYSVSGHVIPVLEKKFFSKNHFLVFD